MCCGKPEGASTLGGRRPEMLESERRDLNPRPPLPQSGALPSCATPRMVVSSLPTARIWGWGIAED